MKASTSNLAFMIWKTRTRYGSRRDSSIEVVGGPLGGGCAQFTLILQLSSTDRVLPQVHTRCRVTSRLVTCNQ